MIQRTSRETKVEEEKPVKVDRIEEWKVEKILNKMNSEMFGMIERIYNKA